MVKTLIFIHGWASSPEIWQRQKEYFSKDYEVILPEISKAKNITEAANIVNDLIKDKKGIVLIGWSLGWLVVLELLKNLALEPKGIIAVTATAKFSDDGYLGKGPTDTHLAKMIRDCKCNPQKTLEDFYKSILTDTGRNILSCLKFKNIAFDKLIYGLYMLRDCDYRDFIPQIHLSALIITGRKDTICIPEASEYMYKKIARSELMVFDCGHMPFLDKAEEFNSAINDFIAGL